MFLFEAILPGQVERMHGPGLPIPRTDYLNSARSVLSMVLQCWGVGQAASGHSLYLEGQCATFYIDNDEWKCALIKRDAEKPDISISARILRAFALEELLLHGETPSDINISDLPTRNTSTPL